MSQARTYFGYWLIEPLAPVYKDRFDSVPDICYSTKTPLCGRVDIALFLAGDARFVRVMVADYSEGFDSNLPKDDEIASVVERIGTVLRLAFNGEASFSRHVLVTTYGKKEKHVVEIRPKIRDVDLSIREKALLAGFEFCCDDESNALLLQLLADAQDSHIPPPFRYLSLYKVLELKLRKNNHWNKSEFDRCIAMSGVGDQKPTGTSLSTKKWIHALRDKCAHFANGENVGATIIDKKSMRQISTAMPLLGKIVSQALGQDSSNLFHELVSGTSRRYQLVEAVSGRVLSED